LFSWWGLDATRGSIGGVLIDHGRYEDALPYFERFIAIAPEDERGWGGKGHCLLGLGRHGEALYCAEKVMNINPKNLESGLSLTCSILKERNTKK